MTPEPSDPVVQRRVAVGPVVAAVVALVVFAVIVTVVITLAAASLSPTATATPTAASSLPSPAATSVPAPESTLIPPSAESTGTRCFDYTAEVSALDIESAQVAQRDRDEVEVEVTLAKPWEGSSAQLGIYAERADGDRAYQFSLEIDDGEIEEFTSHEFDRDDADELDVDDAELSGSTVRFLVPRSIGKKLGDEWSWFAFSAADGSTIDTCPGVPNAPEYLRFER
ncbi:hypothetical protein CLV85_2597 [Salinibacterium amurskyense]|uniref:Uncharacterized protein n=1 Tax=Salinibacterium amurskyense TaxID=205941 RepID=A0A2M9D1T5_9MICO|nr:hypothetical protein [Salinibacterium amurskyense]PJJ78142.1 hypothetical protein CLV85_2597 [Salinibacterium amurskyense]RLQ80287.1 hypothetical protein D9C83_12925 [Salinibacterium amurskyense]GHD82602.1 hypothetical protein GCM10007394_19550 [Salinibacterium amurskyense]